MVVQCVGRRLLHGNLVIAHVYVGSLVSWTLSIGREFSDAVLGSEPEDVEMLRL